MEDKLIGHCVPFSTGLTMKPARLSLEAFSPDQGNNRMTFTSTMAFVNSVLDEGYCVYRVCQREQQQLNL